MEKKSPDVCASSGFFRQNFVSISDQEANILDDVETCRTFTWVLTVSLSGSGLKNFLKILHHFKIGQNRTSRYAMMSNVRCYGEMHYDMTCAS